MKIEDIFCEVMQIDSIPENFEDLEIGDISKWDSLSNMLFLMALEKNLGIRFSFDDMSELLSIKAIKLKISSLTSNK